MDKLEIGTENDNNQQNEKFKYKERILLTPIICLSLLQGISSTVNRTALFALVKGDYSWTTTTYFYYGILNTVGAIPGIFVVPLLMDVRGRKPAFMLLYFLYLLSLIVNYFSQVPLIVIGNVIVALARGGAWTITTLAICEYCGPKHRFAYLVADQSLKLLSAQVTDILSVDTRYVSSVAIVITLACMVSVYWWPESPYWLASQGRVEESRASLLWLRAENVAARAELQALETPRRAKSFCLSLLVAVLSVIVAKCSYSAVSILVTLDRDNETLNRQSSLVATLCGCVVISLLFVLISYKVKRKILYLYTSVLPLVLVLILSIWAHKGQTSNNAFAFYVTVLICNILLECGPFNLSLALSIEIIPQKYYTYISCIYSLIYYLSHIHFPILSLNYRYSFPLYISLYLFTSVALVAVMLLQWLSPETRGKDLSEIEKQYCNRHRLDNPKQDQNIEFTSRL